MKPTTFIYCLCEPGTKVIRYFGKTDCSLRKRLTDHRHDPRKNHKTAWFRKLKRTGQIPDIHLLSVVTRNDFVRFERAFILLGRQCGFDLTNLTDGGEGMSGMEHTEETKAKISKANTGRKATPETKANQAKAQLGRKHPPEVKAKISKAQNTSGFNGVSKLCGKWRVAIDRKCLGYFSKIEDAVFVRNLYIALQVTQRISRANKSGYRGVDWKADLGRFRARIKAGGKTLELGRFCKAIDAAIAYDQAAQIYFGKSAHLNFSYDPACFI